MPTAFIVGPSSHPRRRGEAVAGRHGTHRRASGPTGGHGSGGTLVEARWRMWGSSWLTIQCVFFLMDMDMDQWIWIMMWIWIWILVNSVNNCVFCLSVLFLNNWILSGEDQWLWQPAVSSWFCCPRDGQWSWLWLTLCVLFVFARNTLLPLLNVVELRPTTATGSFFKGSWTPSDEQSQIQRKCTVHCQF